MSLRSLPRRIRPAIVITGIICSAPYGLAAETKNGFDVENALVPAAEILWGGVSRDGIPSIDKPKFVDPNDADFLRAKDRVLGVYHNDIARAYPIRILDRHEIVNDLFADEAIVVTYCPLCFSGMAFTARTANAPLTFGVSGLLYNSDVLLYDRQTGSLWSQIRSQAISGPLKGVQITPIAAAHTTWRNWRERHPDTQVLSTDTGYAINYARSPYREYQRSRQLMFPVRNRNDSYGNKDLVLGISIDGVTRAYPFKELRKHGRVSFTDTVGDTPVTIEWLEDEQYARALDREKRELPTVIVYWFAWYAFHPGTEVFRADSG